MQCLLLLADASRILELPLGVGDLAGELLDLRTELADASRGVRDLRLEVADRALVGGDRVLLLVGLRVAPATAAVVSKITNGRRVRFDFGSSLAFCDQSKHLYHFEYSSIIVSSAARSPFTCTSNFVKLKPKSNRANAL